jgi:hypothetical protein
MHPQFLIITFVIGAPYTLYATDLPLLCTLLRILTCCCRLGADYVPQQRLLATSAVTFEGFYFNRSDQIILASSRVAGICTGVLAALLLTCTVFPISGSGMVLPAGAASHGTL